MAVDWTQVETDVVAAIKNVVKQEWGVIAASATSQVQALITIGQEIEAGLTATPPITPADYAFLKLSAQRALEGVLQTYAAIGLVVAQQVADAAVNVVVDALKAALPAVAFL